MYSGFVQKHNLTVFDAMWRGEGRGRCIPNSFPSSSTGVKSSQKFQNVNWRTPGRLESEQDKAFDS